MSRRAALPVLPVSAVLFLATFLGLACAGREQVDNGPASAEGIDTSPGRPAVLYFPAASGSLEAEPRTPTEELDNETRRRWIIQQLLDGPSAEQLTRSFAEGTELTSFYATVDGHAFVDLALPTDSRSMGSTEELLSIYSLVNTVLMDEPSLSAVVLLFNGRQRETLGGHIDTSRPLVTRLDLIPTPEPPAGE